MEASSSRSAAAQTTVVAPTSSSDLSIKLHPLPILNISEHVARARSSGQSQTKLVGALLGSQSNRDVSIVNSFEIKIAVGGSGSSEMEVEGVPAKRGKIIDTEFLDTRKDQFKQVFPTQDIIGWYTVGSKPTPDDIKLHEQMAELIDNPVFLLFTSETSPGSADLPIRLYESALQGVDNAGEGPSTTFLPLNFGVETGEAERIAVDDLAKGGFGAADETSVSAVSTQRNAIRMLYDRMGVITQYVGDVLEGRAVFDHNIVLQISSLVGSLPTIDAPAFKEELNRESADDRMLEYLSTLTKQLDSLSDYADKHAVVFPPKLDEFAPQPIGKPGKMIPGFPRGKR